MICTRRYRFSSTILWRIWFRRWCRSLCSCLRRWTRGTCFRISRVRISSREYFSLFTSSWGRSIISWRSLSWSCRTRSVKINNYNNNKIRVMIVRILRSERLFRMIVLCCSSFFRGWIRRSIVCMRMICF